MRPVDRTISLIETLASAEEAPDAGLPAVSVDIPEETPEPESVEQAEAEPEIPEAEEIIPAAAADDAVAEDDQNEPEPAVEPDPALAEIIPEPAEEVMETVPEDVPEAVHEEEMDPMPPAEPEPAAEPDPVPAAISSESTEAVPMDSWMTELMVVLVVIIILFTGACAIRNAYRAPLPRLIAAAISILVTALAWVLSLVIAGPSEVYPVYLILLTVYIVLRSKGRS